MWNLGLSMLFYDRFFSFIKEHALFESIDQILLGVSGGRDSVLLAHLFHQAGFNFGIAHVNFKLRGDESYADEQFVASLAKRLKVPFFSVSFDTLSEAKQQGVSIQMAARDLRYAWFEKIRSAYGYKYVALAHHRGDTVETMLLNLVRGTGVAGLHGILPKRDAFIRPLLDFSRQEIDQMIDDLAISYREDSSNTSSKYARNKLRLEVIPLLKALNPSLEKTFEANRKRFADLEVLLQQRVAELRDRHFKIIAPGEWKIELAALKGLQPLDTLLFELFKPFGFSQSVLQDLYRSWEGEVGRKFESATYVLLLDRAYLLLSERRASFDDQAISIYADDDQAFWGNWEMVIAQKSISAFHLVNNPYIAQLDADTLQFPLKIRSWEEGDFFTPLGLQLKRKKLSDIFIAQKLPLTQKKHIPILVNGNGDILYVGGYRINERNKVKTHTQKVFIIYCKNSYE